MKWLARFHAPWKICPILIKDTASRSWAELPTGCKVWCVKFLYMWKVKGHLSSATCPVEHVKSFLSLTVTNILCLWTMPCFNRQVSWTRIKCHVPSSHVLGVMRHLHRWVSGWKMRIANRLLKFSAAKWINAELGPLIGFIKPLNPLNPNLTKVDPQFSLACAWTYLCPSYISIKV